MKKSFLFVLLLILTLGFCSNLFAQVPVTIGDGTLTNDEYTAPAPYGTWYLAFRQQFLIRASEFNNAGGGPGEITSVAFEVQDLNGITPMTNFRIRVKPTTQTALTSSFEAGDYQTVFQEASFIPTVGWNTHTFSTPFVWDGVSNLLVEAVTDIAGGSWADNASVYYSATTFNSSLRFQSDSANGDTATTGSTSLNRSNMKFMMQQLDMQDMVALSITGPNAPALNTPANFTVRVKSLCPQATSNYTVKLMMAPEVELGSQPGVNIQPMGEQDFEFTWTPTEEGAFQLFGRVVMPGDENPANDDTPMHPVTIIPEGLVSVAIGNGTQTNTTTGAPTPYATYWQNFREQYLVLASEINNGGGGPGEIYGISFNVDQLNNLIAMPNYRIRIKHTTQTALSTTFETGQYTQVFQAASFMPTVGWNFHPFAVPFDWDGASNLLIDVVCDLTGQYTQNASVFYHNAGFNSSLRFQSDSSPADQATTGTVSMNRSNMILNMQQLDMQDMVGLSVSGTTTPSVNSTNQYTVRVKNLSPNAVSNYTVKLMEAPNTLIASTDGVQLGAMEEADFVLSWTPTVVGPTQIFGRVELPGDENPANNNTPMLAIDVMEAGLLVVQVGNGTTVNTDTGNPAPYGTWYKAFREQYLIKADDIYAAGGAPGLINSLAFNVQNVGETTPMNNFRIRLKHTQQTALSTAFEAGEYEQVFQAASLLPTNGWNVHVFSEPFFWNGGDNLLVDIVTDIITGTYARNAIVYNHNAGYNATLRFQSDSANGDTGTTGTANVNRPNIRFFMLVEGMGSMSGVVTSGGAPVEGALVVVENTVFSTTSAADGSYTLPFVPTGEQTVTASKHGYYDDSYTVTIVEDENFEQDFELELLPNVTVTGRIVGSDNPTVGLADGTITLSGYQAYSAETDANGNFTIEGVYSDHVYTYNATALGYAMTNGAVEVGTTNVNMGDIIVAEVAYPPHSVIATQSDDFQSVNLTWEGPVPGGAAFEDDFESYADFATEFGDWTLIDVDGSNTYGFSGIQFPGSGTAMSYIIFNPSATTPPMDYEAHSGDKFAACFASVTPTNNDWMITPQVLGGGEVRFWAKTYMDYGLERFKVGVSTTGTDVADFTFITGPSYVEAPLEWTEFVYDLSAYAGQQIYVGLNCVSDDCFIFWVDDFYVGPTIYRNQLASAREAASQHTETAVSSRGTAIPRTIVENPIENNIVSRLPKMQSRALTGYNVYRLLTADMQNEANWTTLNTAPITDLEYLDGTWGPLPSGVYRYAVKAIYTNNVMSNAAFSAELHKGMMGILTGVVTELGTDLPIEGVTITAGEYSGTTNANGEYSFDVYAGTYTVTAARTGYETVTQPNVTIVGLQTTTLDFVMNEITLPVANVVAEEAGNNVNITWMEPGTAGGEWLTYTVSDKDDSIGTGSAADFDVAIRFPASALADYAGMSLQAVKAWPAQAGNFSIRVWTGGSASAPGAMVVDQPFTPALDEYNMVILDNPVTITGNEELWFGYRCNVSSGYPAAVDQGPAVNGFGNMMYFQGEWATLIDLAPSLNYNWMIEGYVGYSAPDRSEWIAIDTKLNLQDHNESRSLQGYRVWRLLQGQESNEAQWTALNANPISATAYQDTGWGSMPDGYYRWAVRAEYTGGALSIPIFSNTLRKLTQIGTVAGFVRNTGGQGISGATVSNGEFNATTNAQGAYTLMLPAGTHTITATHPLYATGTQTGVIVATGQTTALDFILQDSPVVFSDDFEAHADFAQQFDPWTLHDIDGSNTYGFSGVSFPGSGGPMSFIIFNPTATTPPIDYEAHSGNKFAACFASVTPTNNDWMITPQLPGGGTLKFWAKTYMDYGLERLKVGISTTGNQPANFNFIQQGSYLEIPLEWTEYEFDLGAYAGQDIYIAFNCVSDDCFILWIDDVEVSAPTSVDDSTAPVVVTELKGNYPNPFNPETTISFSIKDAGFTSIDIYNVKGQLVRKLVNGELNAGTHTVVWNGKDNSGRDVSSGVYYYKMSSGKYSSTKKMVLMK